MKNSHPAETPNRCACVKRRSDIPSAKRGVSHRLPPRYPSPGTWHKRRYNGRFCNTPSPEIPNPSLAAVTIQPSHYRSRKNRRRSINGPQERNEVSPLGGIGHEVDASSSITVLRAVEYLFERLGESVIKIRRGL